MAQAAFLIGLEHVLIVIKLLVRQYIPDSPMWVLKSQEYARWLDARDEEYTTSAFERDAAALQQEYDDESDGI